MVNYNFICSNGRYFRELHWKKYAWLWRTIWEKNCKFF